MPKTKAQKTAKPFSQKSLKDETSTLGLSGIDARGQEEADLLGGSGKKTSDFSFS